MEENMNNVESTENEVQETEVYDLVEEDSSGDAKAVAIGAIAAAVVTASIYGGYKLVGKAKAAWNRRKLKKQAEEEIERAKAFDEYEEAVEAIHNETD